MTSLFKPTGFTSIDRPSADSQTRITVNDGLNKSIKKQYPQ